MRGFDELTPATLWEWHAELDSAWVDRPENDRAAYLIRYRAQPDGAWRSFRLYWHKGEAPTDSQVLGAIAEHAGLERRPAT